MSRISAAAVLIAALVLFAAAATSISQQAVAQEPDATSTPIPTSSAESTPVPTATPPPTSSLPPAEPTPIEPPPIIEIPYTPEILVESSVEAFEAPYYEEPAPESMQYYGDYVRTPREPAAPVYSFEELQVRIDELLAELPGVVGVAVLRPGEVVFTRDDGRAYRLASVSKLYILAAYLDMLAVEQRPPDEWEYELLHGMITYSDNDAAEYLWEVLGGNETIIAFLNSRGFFDYLPSDDGSWGGSADTPTEVAAFVAQLTSGAILDPDSTSLALSLLSQVSDYQRWGVTSGVGAYDPDAIILLKDGWYPEYDGWLVNSAGIVIPSTGMTPYSIVILSEGFLYYDEGLDAVNEIAQLTNSLMLRPIEDPGAAFFDPDYTLPDYWLYP